MTDGLLDQDEIDALLGNTSDSLSIDDSGGNEEELLSDMEKDTLGEIGNISMGTSATTLFTLLGQKVTITTPKVTVIDIEELAEYYPIPFVAIEVKYKVGLEGVNLLILKVSDVKIIADLMMGGEGKNLSGDLTEIDLSAIGEAMNQMVGSASTSLSGMIGEKIDIDPPKSYSIDFQEDKLDVFSSDEKIVKISFKMIVGDLIDSEIMQLVPISFAKSMVKKLTGGAQPESTEETITQSSTQEQLQPEELPIEEVQQITEKVEPVPVQQPVQQPTQQQVTQSINPQPVQSQSIKQETVNITTPQFQQFDQRSEQTHDLGIDIIQDIPVEITVQLGKTMRKIGEILDYGPGTIIELDKVLGEPLDIFANEKFIAKGEVIVIEDNFGIRITEIISPSKRIR